MRLSLSFVLPLITILFVTALATIPLFDSLTLRWSLRDLDARAQLIAGALQETVPDLLHVEGRAKLTQLFERTLRHEDLTGLAVCDRKNVMLVHTEAFPPQVHCNSEPIEGGLLQFADSRFHFARLPLVTNGEPSGSLILLHNLDFLKSRNTETRRYLFYLFLGLGVLLSLSTTLVARAAWARFTSGARLLMHRARLLKPGATIDNPELLPLAKDLRALVRDMEADRRSKDEAQVSWDPKALKRILNEELAGDEILIVSNREPYIHNSKNGKIEAQFPASGLVTALEPVMRACSGTWIAHGSGNADRETVDKEDRVRVPPGKPSYQLRRVWLTEKEELGYYHNFSNEGLWPLCHMAHTRPIFRRSDWEVYKAVNQKFADTVIAEARTENPVILVQDYHMALVPRMIRDKLPGATIITFWHIPWPNAEAFSICPWREELLQGLLGSSILGFHTRFHCNNFIDTVDRTLESRIDRETSTISFGHKLTAIRSYPISIEWPRDGESRSAESLRQEICTMNGFTQDIRLGIGVDRLDYTKGILERFSAVEKLLEYHPEWIGKFSFIQIAAPSRTDVEHYQNFEVEVRNLAQKINERFGNSGYQPIHLKIKHHTQAEIFGYFRAADVCMVTSLHDGMNLVAKEFIASRADQRGVLILSQFTGAARELLEALIVNPYDIDQCAQALQKALVMPAEEQRDRMRSMRGLIQEFNVYRWAGRMLMDAARIRQQSRLGGRLFETEFRP